MLAKKYQDLPMTERTKKDFITTVQIQPNTKINKYVKRRLIVFSIVSGVLLINGGATLYSQSQELEEKQKEYILLKKDLKQLKKEGKTLENEVTKLETPEYIEQIARRDYFLSKKGEILFHIPEKK
ncbi:cell division protein DIVIC [Bacillus sp. M6-12]|uniref:FtsB family cell division protein n=1 Tax=Bacillus sp. M6-12 TaxID=2054166 RepID=UPI000C78164F|nr:septum formation initiator family protein [Bacillus sp. M6-12]PLS19221.1 cell division protein DIVIC [Bacillus sp. M6-12]